MHSTTKSTDSNVYHAIKIIYNFMSWATSSVLTSIFSFSLFYQIKSATAQNTNTQKFTEIKLNHSGIKEC